MTLVAVAVLTQAIPADASVPYLWAWVAVAFISATPGVIAAVLTASNRRATREEIEAVRHEVMPNSGSSSFDLLHRLVWDTHQKVDGLAERLDALERPTRKEPPQ